MASLTPYGERIRSIRTSLGLTQLELSIAAGVSERTLRSAEKNRPIRHSYLEAIASSLGVPLPEIAEATPALNDHLTWQRNVAVFCQSVMRAMREQDPKVVEEYAHPNLEVNYAGSVPNVKTIDTLMGQYRGFDGVKKFIENAAKFWEQDPGSLFTLDAPAGNGNLLVLRGTHRLNTEKGDQTWGRFTYVAEFSGGRLLNLDSMMVPCSPPPPKVHIIDQAG
jgi:transcriptional regulator with XRE-family HTH domain